MKAVWYRIDNVGPEYHLSDAYAALYRAARRAGFEIKTERSNITRGWTYNGVIYKVIPTGTYHADAPHIERNRYMPFGAGAGVNPILAMIDAVRICRITTPDALVAILECEMFLLSKAVRDAKAREEKQALLELRLDQTLDGLAGLLREYKAKTAPRVTPGEDDDL